MQTIVFVFSNLHSHFVILPSPQLFSTSSLSQLSFLLIFQSKCADPQRLTVLSRGRWGNTAETVKIPSWRPEPQSFLKNLNSFFKFKKRRQSCERKKGKLRHCHIICAGTGTMAGTSSKAITDSADVLSCLMPFPFFLSPDLSLNPGLWLSCRNFIFFLSECIIPFTNADHLSDFTFSIACTVSAHSLKECCVDLTVSFWFSHK